ncbi:nucleoid-associated protein [Pseudomonas sp. PS1]|uniref:Nucleoid-associated protein n=1 Tax=Stutzerimonas marianensis TaxID=2929513 RepID=A0A9X1W7V6_9GAMM|nr:nucleoid-associated protein [Pseudomonas marianensis]MCJ0975284.1 nucleoid-associated protein [Pseudomonas marianensis]
MNNQVIGIEDAVESTELPSSKFTIQAGITASLERDRSVDRSPFRSYLGNIWNLKNEASIEFVEKLEKKFRKKNKFHSYFSGLPSNQTPQNLTEYIAGQIDFKALVQNEMKLLESLANESDSTSLVGGNVVFMHYKNTGEEDDAGRLLVVMLDKKGAFEFDEKTLEPKRLQPIDTDALRQAAMFDLTLFSEVYPNKDGAAYLHFIEGRSKAEFFKSALGCDTQVSNKESVGNIFEAIKQFSALNSIKHKMQASITQKVYEYIEKNIGQQVELKEIQNVIDGALPPDHLAVGKFSKFANENGYQINAVFEATRYSLNQGVTIKITDFQSNYTVNIKAASIGYSGKPVIVDSNLTYLKIPLSAADRDQIKAVIGEKDEADS